MGEISSFQGARRPLWARFWEPLGVILALLLALGLENAKISIFANSPHEYLDFQGSGGLPGSIFWSRKSSEKRPGSQERAEARSGPPKSLPERSCRASGAPKKTLVTSQSAQEEFLVGNSEIYLFLIFLLSLGIQESYLLGIKVA